jgi:hypothetical protein
MVKGRKQGLDGRNRYRACQELGIKPRMVEVILGDAEVKDYIIRRNIYRRHLTPALRREIVGELRQEGKSTRQIAGMIGTSEGTVRNDLKASGAQDYAPETVTGSDGKNYPAHQQARDPNGMHQQSPAQNYAPEEAGSRQPRAAKAGPPFDLAEFQQHYRALCASVEHFGQFFGCEILATANLRSLDGWRQDFLSSWKRVTGAELPLEYE